MNSTRPVATAEPAAPPTRGAFESEMGGLEAELSLILPRVLIALGLVVNLGAEGVELVDGTWRGKVCQQG